MKFAHIDDNNVILGWYSPDVHDVIPEPNVEVTDEQWQVAIEEGHNTVDANGVTSEVELRSQEEADAAEVRKQNRLARNYLAETDWYVIRLQETGEPIPQEILDARAQARASVI